MKEAICIANDTEYSRNSLWEGLRRVFLEPEAELSMAGGEGEASAFRFGRDARERNRTVR